MVEGRIASKKNNIGHYVIFISLIVLSLGIALLPLLKNDVSASSRVEIREGKIDARRVEGSLSIRLDGPWALLGRRVITPEEMGKLSPQAFLSPFRAVAEDEPGRSGVYASVCCATYSLAIRLGKDMPEPWLPDAILIPAPHAAYRLYADGVLVASAGRISDIDTEVRASGLPALARVDAQDGDLLLLLQTAYPAGLSGMSGEAPILGNSAKLGASLAWSLLPRAALLGAWAILIIHMGMSLRPRPRTARGAILLSLCLLGSLMTFCGGMGLELLIPLSGAAYALNARISASAFYVSLPCIAMAAPACKRVRRFLWPACAAIGILCLAWAWAAPLGLLRSALLPALFSSFFLIFPGMDALRAARAGAGSAPWKSLGSAVLLAGFGYDLTMGFLGRGGAPLAPALSPFGLGAFVSIQASARALALQRLAEFLRRSGSKLKRQRDSLLRSLQRRNQGLHEADRLLKAAELDKAAFVEELSHELREPLASVRLALNAMAPRKGGRPAELRDPRAEALARQASLLASRAEGILAVLALMSKGLRREYKALDLGQRLSFAVANLRSAAESRGACIKLEEPARGQAALIVSADPILIDAALGKALELLIDLLPATPAGERRAEGGQGRREAVRAGTISARALKTDISPQVLLDLDAPGLTEAEACRLIEKEWEKGPPRAFAPAWVKGKTLTLIRASVEAMGGVLELLPRKGGLLITLRLPEASARSADRPEASEAGIVRALGEVTDLPPVEEEDSAPQVIGMQISAKKPADSSAQAEQGICPEPPPVKARVLAVDDDPDLLSFISDGLSPFFEVTTARDGREALEAVKDFPDTELVVSDVMMPVMDGLELCERLRQGLGRPLPFVFLSARAIDAEIREALAGGAVDYLIKPFSMEALVAKVAALVDFSRRQRDFMKRSLLRHLDSMGWEPAAPSQAASQIPDLEEAAKVFGLTNKQTRVLSLMIKGHTDPEIASMCGLSTKTVSDHVRKILEKADAENRTQLVYRIFSRNLSSDQFEGPEGSDALKAKPRPPSS